MSQQIIRQGNPPIVWSTIDEAFQKINSNFTELYLSIGGSGIDLANISADLIPDSDVIRNLGSPSRRWKDLYLSGNSIYLGNAQITADSLGAVNLPSGSRVGGVLLNETINTSFRQISVSGQSDVLANAETGILNLSGVGINISTNPSTDTITFSIDGVTNLTASSGISLSGSSGPVTISNTGVIAAVAGTGISVNSPNGSVTITNEGVTSLVTNPGSGISLDSSTGTVNITNSAPNIIQPVHRFIAVNGQVTLDATGPNSTLTFAEGIGIDLTTDSGTNTITIGLSESIGVQDFELNVAADDSTLRQIKSGETIKFIGGTGITTSSDSEGAITITASAVSGLGSRNNVSGSTGVISDTATANLTLVGFKSYVLFKIQTSAAAWVRVYTSIAARTADSGRSEGVDPNPGAGVIAEVITTGAETILISPGTVGFNDESPIDTNIQLAVTNKSGGPASITVTLTVLKIED